MKPKDRRGGARAGAGRKADPTRGKAHPHNITLYDDEVAALKKKAKTDSLTKAIRKLTGLEDS